MLSALFNHLFVPDGLEFVAALKRTTHLAIGAHQDDLEIFAYHGIEQCFEETDQWFGGITVTNGAGSPRAGMYQNFSDEAMQRVRHAEQIEAARLGRYGFQAQLQHPSSLVKDPQASSLLVDQLETLLLATRPQTVYLHNPADKHDTHVAVLQRSLDALRRIPIDSRPRRVFGCEVWRDLDWLDDHAKVALPVGRRDSLESALIAAFHSQVEGGKDYINATLGRRRANATFFKSHAVDDSVGYTYAMDLTPFISSETSDLASITDTHLRKFRDDVQARLARFS